MIKQEITYLGVDGQERTEEFWFHFNAAELQEWNLRYGATLGEQLENAIKEENWDLVVDTLKRMIVGSYGRKSPDGKSFIKTEAITNHFLGTEAYSQLFLQLTSDREFAIAFTNGVVPQDIASGQAQLGFRKPGEAAQAPMNRAQRRAQPQDYRRPQQAPKVQQPQIQPDPYEPAPYEPYSLNDEVYQHNTQDNAIPEVVEEQPLEDANGDYSPAEIDQAAKMGVTVDQFRSITSYALNNKN